MIGNVIHALSTCDEKIPPCHFCVGSVLLTVVELGGRGEHNVSEEGALAPHRREQQSNYEAYSVQV